MQSSHSRLKRSDKAIESLTKTYASHLIKVDATEEPSKIIERIIFSIERGV
jgi:hypothetical protein